MKASMWSGYFVDLNPEEMVIAFQNKGWNYSELSSEHASILFERGDPKVFGAQFKHYADEHGVFFLQGHIDLSCKICSDDSTIDRIKKWLDLFIAIGIKSAVLHCDVYSFPKETPSHIKIEKNITAIRKLTDHLQGTDTVLCLENLIGESTITSSIDDLLTIVCALDSPNAGVCLDTGHLNLSGKNQVDFIRRAGDKLKALHIADNEGFVDQHLLPFGCGNVDFSSVVSALREIGYNGLFNYEIPGENRIPLKIRYLKLDYIKKMTEYLFNV